MRNNYVMQKDEDPSEIIKKQSKRSRSVASIKSAAKAYDPKEGVTDLTKGIDGKGVGEDKLTQNDKPMSTTSKVQLAAKGAELLGMDTSTEAGGALSEAASGASMGASLGPQGAIIGGIVGGISGGLKAGAAKKAAARKAKYQSEAVHANNLKNIEEEKDRKYQNAVNGMRAAFSKNLNNNKIAKL